MVAQTTRRAHDDMGTVLQRATLVAHIHSPNAGREGRASHFVQPLQFTFDL